MIRPARPGDAAGIARIWNHYIESTAATFAAVPKTEAEVAALIAARPVFVAEDDAGAIHGFAHYGPFRGGDGYRHTAEHTLYLAPGQGGRGLGRALLGAVEDHGSAAGIHTMWAGISAENPAAIAFHARCGYAEAARLRQVGRKFDRWLDLVLMQKVL